MSLQRQGLLVQTLFNKTSEGKVEWKLAARDSVFQVSFSNYSVQISETGSDYVISLIDQMGQVADSFSDVELDRNLNGIEGGGGPWYTVLKQLYEMARRSALGADKALDEILSELSDDIPF